ncbi:MAG: methylenetetrahydrofolate reductase [Ilumatobacteraceae bacterium]
MTLKTMFRRRATALLPAPISADVLRLVGRTRYELVPMKGVDDAIADLAPGAPVSITCSPVKGVPATLELSARLLDLGHDVVPHVSARLVDGPAEVARIATWLRDHGVGELFVIAGDAERPVGPYADGLSFLRDLVQHDTGLTSVGVPSYPDGHPLVDIGVVRAALHAKQALLHEAGLAGSTTTQMCLDADRIRLWLTEERNLGLELPVDLGVPGVVDRTKLMTMGVRLGIGTSLRFLRKHRSTMMTLLSPGGYDPTELVAGVADRAAPLGIRGLHAFTFNRVGTTRQWQEQVLA